MKRLREPIHIPKTCPICKADLIEYDVLYPHDFRHTHPDDYICPNCQDRVWQDSAWFARLLKSAKQEWNIVRGVTDNPDPNDP